MQIDSIDQLQEALHGRNYVADRGLATAAFLALKLQRPLFLEGEPGVGKTEIAKVIADLLDTELIRLQCYEGLDVDQAVWEHRRVEYNIAAVQERMRKVDMPERLILRLEHGW